MGGTPVEQNRLSTSLHTDEGASGRLPKESLNAGRGDSILGALCRGNAGVVDLDISHAFGERKRREEVEKKDHTSELT